MTDPIAKKPVNLQDNVRDVVLHQPVSEYLSWDIYKIERFSEQNIEVPKDPASEYVGFILGDKYVVEHNESGKRRYENLGLSYSPISPKTLLRISNESDSLCWLFLAKVTNDADVSARYGTTSSNIIEFQPINAFTFIEIEDENIVGYGLPPGHNYSTSVGILKPHTTQRHHKQKRSPNGVESVIIYRGEFYIRTYDGKNGPYNANTDGPYMLNVYDMEPASFSNPDTTDLEFLTVFVPPLSLDEFVWLE